MKWIREPYEGSELLYTVGRKNEDRVSAHSGLDTALCHAQRLGRRGGPRGVLRARVFQNATQGSIPGRGRVNKSADSKPRKQSEIKATGPASAGPLISAFIPSATRLSGASSRALSSRSRFVRLTTQAHAPLAAAWTGPLTANYRRARNERPLQAVAKDSNGSLCKYLHSDPLQQLAFIESRRSTNKGRRRSNDRPGMPPQAITAEEQSISARAQWIRRASTRYHLTTQR